MSTPIKLARRVEELPAYIFSEINAMKAQAQKRGISLLSLAIGDPDLPTPTGIVEAMKKAIEKHKNQVYSPYEGTLSFRQAVSGWFSNRFGVDLSPENEIIALIGSKEGIAHFPIAFCNPGDVALFPSPGYPVFESCIRLAGAKAVPLPLRCENGFLPAMGELEGLLKEHQPKFLLLNFPSNPTTVLCPKETLEQIVGLAKKYDTLIAYDNAYSEVYFDSQKKPHSILEIPGAKEIAIEFHSLSKTFNMTGWRIGFAVGNKDLLAGLLKVKTVIDSGPLLAVQEASEFALAHAEELSSETRKVYEHRRKICLEGLKRLGIEYFPPEATFYVWARVPNGGTSMDFTKALIEKQGLVVTPGIGFGKEGEHFFRLSLTLGIPQIEDALSRLQAFLT